MTPHLVVLGGGAAGLAAARAALARQARPLLVTEGPPGGDCTFTGCVPSKSLIEAAERGATYPAAIRRAREVVAQIAATEDERALTAAGIEVLRGRATFVSHGRIEVAAADGAAVRTISAKRVVVATGSRPRVPPIPGLADLNYLTNETVFELDALPREVAVLGGGAVGCELAQAFARFGAEVTVIEAAKRLLPGEATEASRVVTERFAAEGIGVRTGATVRSVRSVDGGARLELADGDAVTAQRVLVATGREPVTAGLGLATAGVATDERGAIRTDAHLATTRRGVYAAGDVTGGPALTHAAYLMGRIAAENALGRRRQARFSAAAVPRVVFTSPEVAQVGLTEAGAVRRHPRARVAHLPLSEVDRAVTAGRTDGFVTIVAGRRRVTGHLGGGRVLGATVVGERAGEVIHELALAVRTGMFTGRLAQTTHAYPTYALAVQQAAAQFVTEHGGRRARPIQDRGPSPG
ncbi:dihydrolipoyl dehydrogenase family protein [Salinactinospora qingdaonensis]|uniref:FAD-dependent oxidoreductase n=1 Tax=Salinactinospora qingdaonensis TaxID=702744 RepID=A0ABP7F5Q5_9ACTN